MNPCGEKRDKSIKAVTESQDQSKHAFDALQTVKQ